MTLAIDPGIVGTCALLGRPRKLSTYSCTSRRTLLARSSGISLRPGHRASTGRCRCCARRRRWSQRTRTGQRVASKAQARGWVFLNLANVQSYTLGRIIIDTSNVYCSEKRAQRQPGQWVRAGPGFRRKIVDDHRDIVPDRAELLASCCYGPPNELYAKQVAYHIAWRDGDAATRAAVDASREADHQAWLAEGKRLAARIRGDRPLDDKRLAGGHTGAVATTQAPDAGAGSAGRSGMTCKFACPTRCKPIPLDR